MGVSKYFGLFGAAEKCKVKIVDLAGGPGCCAAGAWHFFEHSGDLNEDAVQATVLDPVPGEINVASGRLRMGPVTFVITGLVQHHLRNIESILKGLSSERRLPKREWCRPIRSLLACLLQKVS